MAPVSRGSGSESSSSPSPAPNILVWVTDEPPQPARSDFGLRGYDVRRRPLRSKARRFARRKSCPEREPGLGRWSLIGGGFGVISPGSTHSQGGATRRSEQSAQVRQHTRDRSHVTEHLTSWDLSNDTRLLGDSGGSVWCVHCSKPVILQPCGILRRPVTRAISREAMDSGFVFVLGARSTPS